MRNGWKKLRDWAYAGYVWTAFLLILSIVNGLVVLLRNPTTGRRVVQLGARSLLRLAGVPTRVTGLEHLPQGAHVLIVNHNSFVDPIALFALLPCKPGYAFAVRQQVPAQRLLCPLLRAIGSTVLDRPGERRRVSNVELMADVLRRGERLIVFPEGRFGPEEGLGRFHSGAFRAAMQAQVPIVVAGLRGTREALPPGTWRPRHSVIALEIGPTLAPLGGDNGAIPNLVQRAQEAMLPLTGLGELP